MARDPFRFAILASAAGFLMLGACRVDSKYTVPSAPVPAAYKELGDRGDEGEWAAAHPSDDLSRGKWWERFNDPELNALEEKTAISNQNIAAAAANVQAARAMIRQARAQYYPQLTVNPAIANSRISTAFGQTVGISSSVFSLPLDATWEPDLWGRIRNSVKANTYAAQVSAADLENVRLAAQADVAADYYELRAQDALKLVLDATVTNEKEAVELTAALLAAGMDSDEAVAQAQAQLLATEAQDTNLGVLRAQYEHAIAVLAGQTASEFAVRPEEWRPTLPSIPTGIASALLERRPDIAAAERAVAQANAQIGLAKTAYYPTVTLSAAAGFQSLSMAKWLMWPSRIWSVGPALAETVLDGGSRKAAVQQSQAIYDQTVANYRQTVLTAFQQVEDSLAALRILNQVMEQQDGSVEAAARSLAEAVTRYRAGLDPYLDVLAAQTVLLNCQQSAVTYRSQQMVASVQLIKALGGGWDVTRLPAEKALGMKISVDDRARH